MVAAQESATRSATGARHEPQTKGMNVIDAQHRAEQAELAALREALRAADEYIGALIENRRTNRQQVRNKVCLTGTAYRAARAQVKP